jgi:hypothetical protein
VEFLQIGVCEHVVWAEVPCNQPAACLDSVTHECRHSALTKAIKCSVTASTTGSFHFLINVGYDTHRPDSKWPLTGMMAS